MSDACQRDLYSITQDEWRRAILNVPHVNKKDATILKLYFTCLKPAQHICADEDNDSLFVKNVQLYMRQRGLPQSIDPCHFDLSEENCQKVKSLLLKLQQSQVQDDSVPSAWIETLTNILFEVLQFVGIIPNEAQEAQMREIEELKSVSQALEGIKNNLIDFRNLVK